MERDEQRNGIKGIEVEFQLTRSRGARLSYLMGELTEQMDFNSRAHVERDILNFRRILRTNYFNSRAHVERDIMRHIKHRCSNKFQLTRSRGARLYEYACRVADGDFNSRAHVERDD